LDLDRIGWTLVVLSQLRAKGRPNESQSDADQQYLTASLGDAGEIHGIKLGEVGSVLRALGGSFGRQVKVDGPGRVSVSRSTGDLGVEG
jgi:hypothetical protein